MGYEKATSKETAPTIKAVNDFADRIGVKDQMNKSLVPLVSDYALVPVSASITEAYSSCNLHDSSNLMGRIIQLLPTNLAQKWEDTHRLFQRAGRKRPRAEMRALPPNEISLNVYLTSKSLNEEEKEDLAGRELAW